MKHHSIRNKALTALLIRMMGVITLALADAELTDKNWQINTLNTPSKSQLQREKNGSVTIYHGLTDKIVENAMDKQFDRLSSMMFTSVIVTDNSGDAVINPETGEIVVEEDSCD